MNDTADNLELECPHCQQVLEIPIEFAGQCVECPACQGEIQIPATTTAQPTCPECGGPVKADAVLCVNCGYDFRTGGHLETTIESAPPAPPPPTGPATVGVTHAICCEQLRTYPIKVTRHFSGAAFMGAIAKMATASAQEWNAGKGTLTTHPDRLVMQLTLKQDFVTVGERTITIFWDELRGLKNKLERKRRFDADFDRKGGLHLTVKLLNKPDALELAPILDALPDVVSAQVCLACEGPVIKGICTSCGKRLSWLYRKRGLKLVAIGSGVAIVCWGPLNWLFSSPDSEGTVTIPVFLVFVGGMAVIAALIGLIQFAAGRRISLH